MAQQANKPNQCDACMKPFQADPQSNKVQWLVVENFKLHPDCFRCKQCNNSIDQNEKYHKKDDGSFICVSCTQQEHGGQAQLVDQSNAGKCYGCGQQIGGSWIKDAQGNSYHSACFKCDECGKALAGNAEGYCGVMDEENNAYNIFCKDCRQKQVNAENAQSQQ